MEDENIKQKICRPLKNKKIILLDENKFCCNFIVTEKINNLIYGRKCSDICLLPEDSFMLNIKERCKKHLKLQQPEQYVNTNLVCKHIITQGSRNLDRSGMICNHFTFDSPDKNYCKAHANKKHEDTTTIGKTFMRSFKVRCYPTKQQKPKLEKYFGDTRYTYNLCVKEKAFGNFINLRNKYVTEYKTKYNFLEKTPKAVREFAVKEYVQSIENNNKKFNFDKKKEIWKSKN